MAYAAAVAPMNETSVLAEQSSQNQAAIAETGRNAAAVREGQQALQAAVTGTITALLSIFGL